MYIIGSMFAEEMERLMFEAIGRMKKSGRLDDVVSKTYAMRRLWTKRLQNFTLKQDELFWNGLKVTTLEEMYEKLEPVHKVGGKHIRDYKLLRKTIADAGYGLPSFMGGLERAVKV